MTAVSPPKHAIAFILITVFLDTVSFGLIIPVMPQIMMEITGKPASDAVAVAGLLMFVFAIMQFFAMPILGSLSDRFGRRPVLLLSLAAFVVDYIIIGFANSLWLLFAARAIAGVCGATHAMASAYIADVAPPEKRSQYFGYIGAAFGLGFVIGPALGGLLGDIGSRIPFFVAAGAAFTNLVYGYFVLPETLLPENRREFSWRRANPVGSMVTIGKFPLLFGLFAVLFLMQVAHDSLPSVWTWYTIEKFDWSERQIGASLALVGICNFVVMGFLNGPISRRLGEKNTAVTGLLMGATGFFGFAFASQDWHLLLWIVPFAFMGLATPNINSIMVGKTASNAQGELQGIRGSLAAVSMIIAPLFMTQLMAFFSSDSAPFYFPGASYATAGSLMFIGCILFVITLRRLNRLS
ncbi:MAG: DHA1 family tetracycline resistance protein-like MFS transporter [Gammaproteobacteria bacterium]|jgi:DHA1 family tetracycline resistance protein-like MFS transporter